MTRRLILALLSLAALMGPAHADYDLARQRFTAFPEEEQTRITLALIATGDFEALAEHGFTRFLYDAIRRFERREGYTADGVLEGDEIRRLEALSERFYERLGNRYYTHAVTGARLLVPRKLFDSERPTADGMLFERQDGMLSLSFVSFPDSARSFDDLYHTLSSDSPDRRIIYRRRFASHFVATGFFTGRKFYTWMARTGGSTTGFTVSWSDQWEEMGRKVSVLLANAYRAD
jgi:hypothetical protein